MELITEIIVQISIWMIQFFGELILQAIGELIFELIGHSIKKTFPRFQPIRPLLTTIIYLILGAVAGVISLWFLPTLFISEHWLRIVNLILTPIASGILMSLIGNWRRSHNQELIQLNSFSYGVCFALSMAIVRFIWAN
ncbi:hypothetical protein RGU72_17505 [Undibacterium sp. 5I1]|uniref:hypothetical protein n=1 Tax=unclassified Undibacterium TaxID=2630295 RepID=UPI002AB39B1F|nr:MULTISPECIES: hypothetical protein [unclassified Undibacterium]MDY7540053.1 hypothetical protein [Undibacterium sp. 5I1]MEB0232623.1 hypothetical protein [Undibacterium sp. 10I3]MEB0257900.1 hypothetical protein [Undibacterium sp. 5I1]